MTGNTLWFVIKLINSLWSSAEPVRNITRRWQYTVNQFNHHCIYSVDLFLDVSMSVDIMRLATFVASKIYLIEGKKLLEWRGHIWKFLITYIIYEMELPTKYCNYRFWSLETRFVKIMGRAFQAKFIIVSMLQGQW